MEYLFSVLERIRSRPEMYIGRKSLSALADFIGGFLCAVHTVTGNASDFGGNFQTFTEIKFRCVATGAHWSKIISQNRSPEEAFDLFFVCLEEFKTVLHRPGGIAAMEEAHRALLQAWLDADTEEKQ